MQHAMEADQDNPPSRRGSFYVAEDSFLLSDYLHRQAEKAGNRFFNNTNSLLFLRSTLLLSELEQKDLEENPDRCCFPELKSTPLALSATHKESSESFTGRECSSRILSELEQERGNSSLPHRILASCVSYVESSECCESVEAATRIEANSESLHNMLCRESRQAISLSIDDEEEEEDVDDDDDEDGTAEEALTASLGDTEALNLLVTAAMQVDNDDGDDDCDCVVGPVSLKKSSSPDEGDALAIHGNSPIVKRKVIRRAKSAFQKQNCDDQLHKLELSGAPASAFEKKARPAVGTHIIEQVSHKGFVAHTKCRKLRDLSLDPSNALTAAHTNLAMDLERSQDEGETWPFEFFGDVKEEISVVENLQVLTAKIPSSLHTEDPKIAHRQDGNHGHFVDHRKLQILSARLSDACNAEHSKGLQMQVGQPRIRLKLENSQTPPSNKNGLATEGVISAIKKETKKSSMDRLRNQEKEVCLGITQLDDTTKGGSSGLRLKILPIRLPSADLPLLQEVSKSESTEVILEDRIVTRKRRTSSSGEQHDKAVVVSELMLHKEVPLQDTQVKDGDPVIRSKRGRSQVLPTKFSDSVLQPWKSSRKRCKTKF